jgi:hypothetical protein
MERREVMFSFHHQSLWYIDVHRKNERRTNTKMKTKCWEWDQRTSLITWSLPQSQTDKADSMEIHGVTPHISIGQIQIRSYGHQLTLPLTLSHHLEVGDPPLPYLILMNNEGIWLDRNHRLVSAHMCVCVRVFVSMCVCMYVHWWFGCVQLGLSAM